MLLSDRDSIILRPGRSMRPKQIDRVVIARKWPNLLKCAQIRLCRSMLLRSGRWQHDRKPIISTSTRSWLDHNSIATRSRLDHCDRDSMATRCTRCQFDHDSTNEIATRWWLDRKTTKVFSTTSATRPIYTIWCLPGMTSRSKIELRSSMSY